MSYPEAIQYQTAIRKHHQTLFDVELKQGECVEIHSNYPLTSEGGCAVVFSIQTLKKRYAIRCWHKEMPNIKKRYEKIQTYLVAKKLPYFVAFEFQEKGIALNNSIYPILKMDWLEDAIPLKEYIHANIKSRRKLQNLANEFAKMVQTLHYHKIAHGDLHDENLFVTKNGELRLIDYDGMYVPELEEKRFVRGIADYQHPNFLSFTELNERMDYFSELVIYLSLLVIIDAPDYWQEIFNKDNQLLFTKEDIENLADSNIYHEILHLSAKTAFFARRLLKHSQELDENELLPLEVNIDDWFTSRWRERWECSTCGELNRDDFTTCAKCNVARTDVYFRILLRDKIIFQKLETEKKNLEIINNQLAEECNLANLKLNQREENLSKKRNELMLSQSTLQKRDIAITQLQTDLSFYQRKAKRLAIWRTIFLLAFIVALVVSYFIHL